MWVHSQEFAGRYLFTTLEIIVGRGDDETISLHYLVDDDVETKSADRW